MKFYLSLGLLFSVQMVLAQTTSHSASSLVRSLTIPERMKLPGAADACEELLPAACYNSLNQYRSEGLKEKLEEELQEIVDEAKNLGAKSLGYANQKEAVIARLNAEGFRVKKGISEKAQDYLVNSSMENYTQASEIFQDSSECVADMEELKKIQPYNLADKAQIETAQKQVEAIKLKYESRIKMAYLKNLPGLMQVFGSKCEEYTKQKETLQENQKLDQKALVELEIACKARREIRRQVIELYTASDSAENKEKSNVLIDKLFKLNSIALTEVYETPIPAGASELQAQQYALTNKIYSVAATCYKLDANFQNAPRSISEKVNQEITTTRATVEFLIERFYKNDRHEKALKIFNTVRSEVMSFVRRLTTDPAKLSRISEHYKRLKLNWFSKPANSEYEKDPKTGIEHLKVDSYNPNNIWATVFTPELDFFLTINAFYIPDVKFGAQENELSVTMQPLFLELLDENPWAYLSVLAHEVGHNIGPELSQINNYSLLSEYDNLLQCLSSTDSIRMQKIQYDESVADYVSSEVLARLLTLLPQDQKRSALYASMQPYCWFNEESDNQGSIDFDSDHPESFLRLNGIFGGSAPLRKAMGCKSASKKVRTCSLQGGE